MGNAEWTLQLRRLWRIVALAAVLASLLGTVVIAALGVALWPVKPGSHSVFQSLLSQHCRMLLQVLGVRVVRDPYRSPDSCAPTLYLANHVSYLDILVIAAQWRTGFLAKSEVGTWPLVGYLARACGTIFVKRNSLLSRAMCIEKILARLEAGGSMLVFPEGTTSVEGPRKKWRPFFSGAVSAARWAGADLKLLYLDYEGVSEIAWLGDDALLPNLWKILGRESTRVRLREREVPSHRTSAGIRDFRATPRQMRLWLAESGFNTI